MKKFLVLFIFIFLLFPLASSAGSYQILHVGVTPYTVNYEGLVPCGKCMDVDGYIAGPITKITDEVTCLRQGYFWRGGECFRCQSGETFVTCTLCHIFVMINGIVSFILLKLVPPIATIVFILGGISFYFAAGSTEKVNKAKSVLTSAVIGLVIIYASWLIISEIFSAVGIADWVGFGSGWYQINCEINLKLIN
jgi:hypothetical protein